MHIGVVRVTVEQVDWHRSESAKRILGIVPTTWMVMFSSRFSSQHVYGGADWPDRGWPNGSSSISSCGFAHQRLGDSHTLAQTAGQFGQTVPRLVSGDASELQRLEVLAFWALVMGWMPNRVPVKTKQHGLFGGEDWDRHSLRKLCGTYPMRFVHLACGLAQHGQAAMAAAKASSALIIDGFAGAVGADGSRDRTGGNGEGAMLPDDMKSPRLMAASLNLMRSEVFTPNARLASDADNRSQYRVRMVIAKGLCGHLDNGRTTLLIKDLSALARIDAGVAASNYLPESVWSLPEASPGSPLAASAFAESRG